MADEAPLSDTRELARWRRAVLPIMASLLVACALFFAIFTMIQYDRISQSFAVLQGTTAQTPIDNAANPKTALARQTASPSVDFADRMLSAPDRRQPENFDQQLQLDRFRVAAALEHQMISLRYGQAAQNIMGRLWTRLMGFITGMILAVVGAAFVLGRLEDSGNRLTAQHGSFKGALTSSSPGIVLAVLGSALMIVSIAITTNNRTSDGAIYLEGRRAAAEKTSSQEIIPPVPSLEAQKSDPGPADNEIREVIPPGGEKM